jgi:hypothetical protein
MDDWGLLLGVIHFGLRYYRWVCLFGLIVVLNRRMANSNGSFGALDICLMMVTGWICS